MGIAAELGSMGVRGMATVVKVVRMAAQAVRMGTELVLGVGYGQGEWRWQWQWQWKRP